MRDNKADFLISSYSTIKKSNAVIRYYHKLE